MNQQTLWDTKAFQFTREEAQFVPGFRHWLAQSGSDLGQFLADIQYASEFVDFSKQDVHELEILIIRSMKKRADALPLLRLLGKVVYCINHTLQLSIPQPRLAVNLTPPRNPFAFEDVSLAHQSVRAWLDAEKRWLKELQKCCGPQRQRNVPFELLLLSAALHGGILDQDLAMSLHAAIMNPAKYMRYSSRVYADLSLAWQGKADQDVRRWYPDEGTICLIARIADSGYGPITDEIFDYTKRKRRFCDETNFRLSEQLRHMNVKPSLLPESLSQLFERIALFLSSEMPAVMVAYAVRSIPARSLLPPSIGQIYDAPGLHTEMDSTDVDESLQTDLEEEAYEGDSHHEAEPAWMEPIRACFSSTKTDKLKAGFSALKSDSVVAQRIINYAQSLLIDPALKHCYAAA